MDPRSTAHALTRIADFLELRGENRFKAAAYRNAARAVLTLPVDDLGPALRSGELAALKGIGPATLATIRELVDAGSASYLEQLRDETPEGLIEMLGIPGLGTAKIHTIHEALGVATVDDLERAARDGRLAALPRFGSRTAEKILKGIAYMRETSAYLLFPQARAEAVRLLATVRQHGDVADAAIAGALRRRNEIVRDVDIVAACRASPESVAAELARAPGVRDAAGVGGATVEIRLVDGTLLHLHCVPPDRFAVALWRATGSAAHERELCARAAAIGVVIGDDELRDAAGARIPIPDEHALYAAVGLRYIEPELREGRGELPAAAAGTLPRLIEARDLRGVLHCHSDYSDGKATVAEMAAAAGALGWSYLGISDHSQSAFYAGGLKPDAVLAQHEEIDRLNASGAGVRLLKGIEADILVDGRVDYEPALLDRFDYVIGSVHSRFSLDERAMTDRVLRALDDPHLTVLGHPTGRLLLAREAYAIDMPAVLAKAAALGVAVELNADPHRLDLDWRLCQLAKTLGCAIEIGPDAHSTRGLENMEVGVGIARKGWLEAGDVINTRSADDVMAFARNRRVS
jgi:DNA polymerase (family X)